MTRRPFSLTILVVACAGAAVACGLTDSTSPSATPSVAGTWSYVESFTDNLNGLTCADTGIYNLVESAGSFSGTYVQTGVCRTTDRQVIDNSHKGSVTDGQVTGRHILFKAPGCAYDGLIRVDDDNHVEGTVVCSASTGGTTFHLSGSWSARR